MISGVFLFTIRLLCTVFGCLLLLRAYMRFLGTPSNDPLSQFSYQLTQWAVHPASSFIPRYRNIDFPCIFVAYLSALIYVFFLWLVTGGTIGFLYLFISSFALVISWIVEMAMWVALIYCIFSWVNPTSRYYRTLGYLSDPFLAPFRRVIPVWRNIDFSAIVFFLLASFINGFLSQFI